MKKLTITTAITFLATSFCVCAAQQPIEVYKEPLTKVLSKVESTYNIKLRYDEKNIKGLDVTYATWRFTSNVENTLDNILKPLNLAYSSIGENEYQIREYEYYRRPEAEGKKHLDELLALYANSDEFEKRKAELKNCILLALGISQLNKRTVLNPVFRQKVVMKGYTVENVAFESFPGYYVTGTLYRPSGKGPFPVILCPHGHFYNEENPAIEKDSGRYRADMQYRCAALAKMGAVVFNYDMYSWGESALQTGGYGYHETGFSLSVQTWNSIRCLDFLLSLPNVDKTKVGVTGASGGGTQTILLSALDGRVTASVPVVMVSSSFYGGCPCESGLPIHDCGKKKTNNTEIAALSAPRPQLFISDGSDWTRSMPGTDFPYLKRVYGFYGETENVEQVYLPNDQHDYGLSKRIPMYRFFAKTFGLNLKAIMDKNGNIDESSIVIQPNKSMLVFGSQPLPVNAIKSHEAIVNAFKNFQSQ
jgi:dienelactone hydrolase